MSGPKVVRIVTREEIIAICEGHIARLDAALEEWIRFGRRNDCISDSEIASAHSRRGALAALLTRERFMDLQKQVPQEIDFLTSDLQARLSKVAEAAAAERTSARRQSDAAQALINALRRSGNITADLEQRLQRVIDGDRDPRAIADAFSQLSKRTDAGAEVRKKIAEQHRTGAESIKFQEWLESQPRAHSEARLQTVDRRLSELALADDATAAEFHQRIHLVEREGDTNRRNLLLDSLELDLAKALSLSKQREGLKRDLTLALAELGSLDPEEHKRLIEAVDNAAATDSLNDLLATAMSAVGRARERVAAAARRSAVLKGLVRLGYEVTEGMETAWASEGRVVLRSASRPDYGMEVAGDGSGRVQMRAVAFEDGAAADDRTRDADAETIWCSEVGSLQQEFANAGGGITIEKARAIGEAPLKRVAGTGEAGRHISRGGRAPKTRSLS